MKIMVSETGLLKFKVLYQKEYGIELSQKELIEKANRLLNLYKSVYTNKKNIKIRQKNEKKAQSKKNNK